MSNLFEYELSKFFKQKSLYIILASMCAFGLCIVLMLKLVGDASGEAEMLGFGISLRATISNFQVALFLGIFAAIYIQSDYSSHVVKNVYARGYTRVQFSVVKLCFLLLTTLAFCVVALLINFALSYESVSKELNSETLTAIALQILSMAAYSALFFWLSNLCGKGALAVCIALPYVFLVLGPIVSMIAEVNKNIKPLGEIIYFLPMGLPGLLSGNGLPVWKTALAGGLAAAYLCAFSALGIIASRKREA